MRAVLLVLIGAIALAACNTVQGVGRDVRDAGQAVEKGAKKTKQAIFD